MNLPTLESSSIHRLVSGDSIALHIQNFIPQEEAKDFANRVYKLNKLEPYYHEAIVGNTVQQIYYGVDRLGIPFNSTYGSTAKTLAYFQGNHEAHQAMAELFSGMENPVEKLQRIFSERYEHGAKLAEFDGKQAYSGILRATHCDRLYKIHERPHFDAIPHEYLPIERQWGANIYFDLPSEGGQIQIWDLPDMSAGMDLQYEALNKLKPLELNPGPGDLVIFNSRKPHTVLPSPPTTQMRIALHTFIGYLADAPLVFWS